MACCWSSMELRAPARAAVSAPADGGDDALFAVAGQDGFGGVFHAGDGAKSEVFDPEGGGHQNDRGDPTGRKHGRAQFSGGGVDGAHERPMSS